MSPFIATVLIDEIGTGAPGILLITLAVFSMLGLWCVAPRHDYNRQPQEDNSDATVIDLELKEIT